MTTARFAITRRVTVFMAVLGVCTFGWFSLQKLEIKLLPEISYPAVTVRTQMPGASPEEVENLVSKPIEEALGVISNLQQITSVSSPGNSDVVLEMNWDTAIDKSVMDIREKLDSIELSDQAERSKILRYNPETEPIMRLYLTQSDLIDLRYFAEKQLKQKLESIEGVAAAKVMGGNEEEILVEIDPNRLASMNLSLPMISNRLREENINLPGGILTEGNTEYLVRTLNQFTSIEELKGIIVGNRQDTLIRLEDVADVRRITKDKTTITHLSGQECVSIFIYKEGDANIVEVADRVKQFLSQLNKGHVKADSDGVVQLPSGIHLEILSDSSKFIVAAIEEVKQNAITGALLAGIVLFFFLKKLRHTSIVMITIPVSIIISFALLYYKGISLNIISLGGLALGVGMLVDNSIVVLENIFRKIESGLNYPENVVDGTEEVTMAVTASTLTTIAVFFPIVFITGLAGQIFHDLAYAVTFSLLSSLIVSITVTPMIASLQFTRLRSESVHPLWIADHLNQGILSGFLQDSIRKIRQTYRLYIPNTNVRKSMIQSIAHFMLLPVRLLLIAISLMFQSIGFLLMNTTFLLLSSGSWILRKFWSITLTIIGPLMFIFDIVFEKTKLLYIKLLTVSLNNAKSVSAISFLLLVLLIVFMTPRLGVSLLPVVSQGELNANINLPAGTPLEETAMAIQNLQKSIRDLDGVSNVSALIGSSESDEWNIETERENIAQIQILLTQTPHIDRMEKSIMNSVKKILDAHPMISSYEIRRPTLFTIRTPLEVEVRGQDLKLLESEADALFQKLKDMPDLTGLSTSFEVGLPEIHLVFDRDKLNLAGIYLSDVSRLLQNLIEGDIPTQFKEFENEIDIRVRSGRTHQLTVANLQNLVLNADSDKPVLLGAVAGITETDGPNEIRRVDQQRVILLQADVSILNLKRVIGRVQQIIDSHQPVSGVTCSVVGQNIQMNEAIGSLQTALGLAIFLVYLVMASQFESFVAPLIILTSIPLALIGVIPGLWVLDIPISIIVFIGLIVLAGIVVNNAILLIDSVIRMTGQGLSLHESLIESAKIRMRPIFMTTLTTVLGLFPMIWSSGPGSEMRNPLAWTLILGLSASTFLTLILIPTFYYLIQPGKNNAGT